jgi:HAD superfamily hydrolase (TIGR01509 family)
LCALSAIDAGSTFSNAMPDWPAAVLFDFDGVLVNSEPMHFLALHESLSHFGVDLGEQEYYEQLIGYDDRGAIRHVFARRGRPLEAKLLLRIVATKNRHMMQLIHRRKLSALPGVEELVRGLWRNYPLAICSGALREEIEAMLEAVSLRDCFNVIVAAEDVTVGKPDPSGYLLSAELIQRQRRMTATLRPQDCLVVEDAPAVIRSVRQKGFTALAVAGTYPLDALHEADWAVQSLRPEVVAQAIPNLRVTV